MDNVYVVMEYCDNDGELLGVAATPDGGRAIAEIGRDDDFWMSGWIPGTVRSCEWRRTRQGTVYVWDELVQRQAREACTAAASRLAADLVAAQGGSR